MPKVVNGLSWKLVFKMGMGPRTNLYNIGGDPLTQLNLKKKIFFFNIQKKRWQWENERKIFCWWPTDPLMQSSEHSSLSTALVVHSPQQGCSTFFGLFPQWPKWQCWRRGHLHPPPPYIFASCRDLWGLVSAVSPSAGSEVEPREPSTFWGKLKQKLA